MRALTFNGVCAIRHDSVDDPLLASDADALVAVSAAAICGSDLHVYHGRETGLDPGTVMGHEFVGRIIEVGRDVACLAPGDRVMSPFTTNCGVCFYCGTGLTARCSADQLFGWVEPGFHKGRHERPRFQGFWYRFTDRRCWNGSGGASNR